MIQVPLWPERGSLLNYFVYMVIIIVVAVPEGLPMSVTVSLALAMQKMTRANSLVRQLVAWEFPLIDCQMRTDLLASFGARDIPRTQFTRRVAELVNYPDHRGPWSLSPAAFDDD